MEPLLVDTLLSHCRDSATLITELSSWNLTGVSPPTIESLEFLRLVLAALSTRKDTSDWAPLIKSVTDLAVSRCVPLLISLRDGGFPSRRGVAVPVCQSALSCLALHGIDIGTSTSARAEPFRYSDVREMAVTEAIEIVGALFPTLESLGCTYEVETVIGLVVHLLKEGTDETSNLVCGRLVPVIGTSSRSLKMLWQCLMDAKGVKDEICLRRRLLVLSTLAEYLFKMESEVNPLEYWHCNSYWASVQDGLCNPDGLTRKRAVYLLKRAIDFCQECGAGVECRADGCGDTVVETLEGNQIHVIKPVFPKLNIIFESSVSEATGSWLFHPSWHLCIYKRMFESENKTLAKEGVLHFLDAYTSKFLPESASCSEFIIGPLMDAISESAMFGRTAGQLSGDCPLLATKFEKFLAKFVCSIPEEGKGIFLLKFIKKMTSRNWCAVPILFLAKALANIPIYKIWGLEGLILLREILLCTMTTHQILLRGAAQCFLLQAAMKLTDIEKVSLSDISGFLMCLRADESLDRGSKLWKELCVWIKDNEAFFKKDAIFECSEETGISILSVYIKHLVEDYLKVPASKGENELMPDWFESRLVATMVLLAADGELLRHSTSVTAVAEMMDLGSFMAPLLECLCKLNTNIYMPIVKTDKCLQLLLKLLQICASKSPQNNSDGLLSNLWNIIATNATSILEFIFRRLSGELKTVADLDRCDLYLTIFSEMVNLSLKFGWKKTSSIPKYIYNLMNTSIKNLQRLNHKQDENLQNQIQKVVSMATLASMCGIADACEFEMDAYNFARDFCEYLSTLKFDNCLPKPNVCDERFVEETSSQGWGKIVACYLHDQWVCLSFILQKCKSNIPCLNEHLRSAQTPASSLQEALNVLSVIPSNQSLPVFHCMKFLIPKVLHSSEHLCVECINLAWKIVSSSCNSQVIFWPNLQAFVEFVFSEEILSSAACAKGEVYRRIKEIIQEVIEMSILKTGVFNVLVSHCYKAWMDHSEKTLIKDNILHYAKCYIEILTEACLFGTIFRRDQRLIQDTQAFIESLGEDCAANIVVTGVNKDEHQVRIVTVALFSSLDASNPLHKEFLEELVLLLLDKDAVISKTKTRYYGNSMQHRIKNRLWQTLLILIPKLDKHFLSGIFERILQSGFANNQASVKYLIEWAIILILQALPVLLPKFWDCFSNTEEKLKTSICTFLSVLPHFDVIIVNVSDKPLSLKKALITALQWCFNHNFSVRLYALVALKKLWALCKQQFIQEFEVFSAVIESSLYQAENVQGVGNAKKNWLRIQDHFFFSTFHPLHDYSIETIFYTLPRWSEITEDEWIPTHKFSSCTYSGNPLLPLNNPRTLTVNQTSNAWLQQDIGADLGDTDNKTGWTDIQKKIIPWKNSIPDFDLEIAIQNRAAKLGKASGNLIVVASLIDKPTNLGGLCRTCEIFGASALVVDSLHHVNDKQFQYLSVSAEQWLPLIEVKPQQLLEYLQMKKNDGYTIIGVEQTAKSFDLTEYSFPEKSLLILGNEREGIPANLIQHLDVCVEIPQQGIIRSLNVHVSGAVLIWEYTKQQIIKQKKGGI
ncbi:hypothetical protein GDO86_009620 [Hymenochirus boettgeri]|uniref:tRNA (guanosine(18)-2'-O)-methyltransferase TARBP1 n=1 Tax=Hymenochirus boettgeri TaxID=247094 RepID=A0A8T2JGV8_9PIPI|nr:hypothetical protein GDO86_009620 [Hymenochirus boettgeri]